LLGGSEATDIRLVGIERLDEAVYDPQATEDSQQILSADPAVASLEAGQGVTGDSSAIGELDLGQTAQPPPHTDVVSQLA
jgi:hypothetical protein